MTEHLKNFIEFKDLSTWFLTCFGKAMSLDDKDAAKLAISYHEHMLDMFDEKLKNSPFKEQSISILYSVKYLRGVLR